MKMNIKSIWNEWISFFWIIRCRSLPEEISSWNFLKHYNSLSLMRIKIDTNETDQFNGLFTHLFSSRSENYIRNNILKVTASSIYPDRGDPFDTINPFVNITKFQDYWISQSKERSNITISFLQHHFLFIYIIVWVMVFQQLAYL